MDNIFISRKQVVVFVMLALMFSVDLHAQQQKRDKQVKNITSISELREVMKKNNQNIRMKPGRYRVKNVAPQDDRSVFVCSGSNNHFDLRGVTIEVPSRIYHEMSGPTHSLGGYRIRGDQNTFEGATFVNTGSKAPDEALSEFNINGNKNTFKNCTVITRGSSPYGYSDMFGKGGGSAVPTLKHSAISVSGDGTRILNCEVQVLSFGHGIHMHGADKTLIRNTRVKGEVRPGHEIYQEEDGPAAKFDYKVQFPEWKKGQPIPKNEMIHLPEDGIRAYNGTGKVTVKNCTVKQMRSGITLIGANEPAEVVGCKVTRCRIGYNVSSGSVIKSSAGDLSTGLLFNVPRSHKGNITADLTLLPSKRTMGDHPLGYITGNGHDIRINAPDGYSTDTKRPMIIGRAGGGNFTGRWTKETTSKNKLKKHHRANNITFVNDTPHPVHLTKYASSCTIKSQGPVQDEGQENKIVE